MFDIDECKHIDEDDYVSVYYEVHVDKSGQSKEFVSATKKYGGYHVGSIYDLYFTSQDLDKDLYAEMKIWAHKKIIKYKHTLAQDSSNMEHKVLTQAGVPNEDWYNISTGGGLYLKGGYNKQKTLFSFITSIKEELHLIKSLKLEDILKIPRLQLRDLLGISDQIDRLVNQLVFKHAKLPAIVILKNGCKLIQHDKKLVEKLEKAGYVVKGNDLIIGGNNSLEATIKAKLSLEADCQIISEKAYSKFNLENIKDGAISLNSDSDKPQEEQTKSEWVERLIGRYVKQGIEFNTTSNKDFLNYNNIFDKKMNQYIDYAEALHKDNVHNEKLGVVRVDSKTSRGKKIIKEHVDNKKLLYTENAIHIPASSTSFGIGDIGLQIFRTTGEYMHELPEDEILLIVPHIHIPLNGSDKWYGKTYTKTLKNGQTKKIVIPSDRDRTIAECKVLKSWGIHVQDFHIIELIVTAVK